MPTASPVAEFVIALACIQFIAFGVMVSAARGRYGVHAPATTGHVTFERHFRIQMNTLELLVMFVPLIWLTRAHLGPVWIGALGAVYLVGRMIYFFSYVADPKTRTLGYALSCAPVAAMLIVIVVFSLRAFVLGIY